MLQQFIIPFHSEANTSLSGSALSNKFNKIETHREIPPGDFFITEINKPADVGVECELRR